MRRLASELNALGLYSWPSQANFLLIRVGKKHREFVLAMRQRGILVRDRSADPGCDGCVRITIGSDAQTERLIATLREIAARTGAFWQGDGMRRARIHRKTKETDIRIALTLEGRGRATIGSGIRFLDHMLELVGPSRCVRPGTASDWRSRRRPASHRRRRGHRPGRGVHAGVWAASAAFCAPDIS